MRLSISLCLRGAAVLLGPCLFAVLGCRHAASEGDFSVPLTSASEPLPASDPVVFLSECLKRYDARDVHGYRLTMEKQERIGDELQPREVIEIAFRAQPYSVYMRWLQGARRAKAVLYVEGENDNQMVVHPTGVAGLLAPTVKIDPNGPQAREAGRYSIKEFGLQKTLERTLANWKTAQKNGALHVEYLGLREIAGTGDRPCYTLRRTYTKPDSEGVVQGTAFIDKQTWFQTGTMLMGQDNRLIGEYLFRDIQLNPTFKPDQFQTSALTS
jgi:hypothetical protein